jgi:predicted O-methyltransferase YrrM
MDVLPQLVEHAIAKARQTGFPLTRDEAAHAGPSASLPGVGRFLAVLAAGCHGGRIAELGTGVGIGAAWLASAMPEDCTLVTAELDADRAAAAAEVLDGDPRLRILVGDAMALIPPLGPFDLIFCDGGLRDPAGFGLLVGLLRPGGRIVMDDLTPAALARGTTPGPPRTAPPADSQPPERDVKRQMFAWELRLVWTEVVLPDLENSLLVGTRR